jgi:hypothetical protein
MVFDVDSMIKYAYKFILRAIRGFKCFHLLIKVHSSTIGASNSTYNFGWWIGNFLGTITLQLQFTKNAMFYVPNRSTTYQVNIDLCINFEHDGIIYTYFYWWVL